MIIYKYIYIYIMIKNFYTEYKNILTKLETLGDSSMFTNFSLPDGNSDITNPKIFEFRRLFYLTLEMLNKPELINFSIPQIPKNINNIDEYHQYLIDIIAVIYNNISNEDYLDVSSFRNFYYVGRINHNGGNHLRQLSHCINALITFEKNDYEKFITYFPNQNVIIATLISAFTYNLMRVNEEPSASLTLNIHKPFFESLFTNFTDIDTQYTRQSVLTYYTTFIFQYILFKHIGLDVNDERIKLILISPLYYLKETDLLLSNDFLNIRIERNYDLLSYINKLHFNNSIISFGHYIDHMRLGNFHLALKLYNKKFQPMVYLISEIVGGDLIDFIKFIIIKEIEMLIMFNNDGAKLTYTPYEYDSMGTGHYLVHVDKIIKQGFNYSGLTVNYTEFSKFIKNREKYDVNNMIYMNEIKQMFKSSLQAYLKRYKINFEIKTLLNNFRNPNFSKNFLSFNHLKNLQNESLNVWVLSSESNKVLFRPNSNKCRKGLIKVSSLSPVGSGYKHFVLYNKLLTSHKNYLNKIPELYKVAIKYYTCNSSRILEYGSVINSFIATVLNNKFNIYTVIYIYDNLLVTQPPNTNININTNFIKNNLFYNYIEIELLNISFNNGFRFIDNVNNMDINKCHNDGSVFTFYKKLISNYNKINTFQKPNQQLDEFNINFNYLKYALVITFYYYGIKKTIYNAPRVSFNLCLFRYAYQMDCDDLLPYSNNQGRILSWFADSNANTPAWILKSRCMQMITLHKNIPVLNIQTISKYKSQNEFLSLDDINLNGVCYELGYSKTHLNYYRDANFIIDTPVILPNNCDMLNMNTDISYVNQEKFYKSKGVNIDELTKFIPTLSYKNIEYLNTVKYYNFNIKHKNLFENLYSSDIFNRNIYSLKDIYEYYKIDMYTNTDTTLSVSINDLDKISYM